MTKPGDVPKDTNISWNAAAFYAGIGLQDLSPKNIQMLFTQGKNSFTLLPNI